MPKAHSDLKTAAFRAQFFEINPALIRDSSIGIGQVGPGLKLRDWSEVLQKSLSDLAWELDRGRNALELAVKEIWGQEEKFVGQLEQLHKALEGDGGDKAWNRDSPIWQPGRRYGSTTGPA
jgi:hypothetical protein